MIRDAEDIWKIDLEKDKKRSKVGKGCDLWEDLVFAKFEFAPCQLRLTSINSTRTLCLGKGDRLLTD